MFVIHSTRFVFSSAPARTLDATLGASSLGELLSAKIAYAVALHARAYRLASLIGHTLDVEHTRHLETLLEKLQADDQEVDEFIDYMCNPASTLKRSMDIGGRVLSIYHRYYTAKHSQKALSGGNVDAILHIALGAFHDIQRFRTEGITRLPRGYTIDPLNVQQLNMMYL